MLSLCLEELKTLREKAIQDPAKFLNEWCQVYADTTKINPHKVCAVAKKEFGNDIPANYYTYNVSAKFKDLHQLNNARKRKPVAETKETLENEFSSMPKPVQSRLIRLGRRLAKEAKNGMKDFTIDVTEPLKNIDEFTKQ